MTPRLYVCAISMIGLGCALVAGPERDYVRSLPAFQFALVGYGIGTLFGQTTVAAFWTALGTTPLHRRLLASLLWLTLLLASIVIGHRLDGWNSGLPMAATALAAQWVLVQIPLWLMRFGVGLRLHVGEQLDSGMPQFGLSQLMAFTFGIAVLLAALRWLVTSPIVSSIDSHLLVWLFLAGAAVLLSLPLGLAALLPRFAACLGVPLILTLVAIATAWEHPLLVRVAAGGKPENSVLVWINVFTAAWVLAFAVMARLHGYRLIVQRGDAIANGTEQFGVSRSNGTGASTCLQDGPRRPSQPEP